MVGSSFAQLFNYDFTIVINSNSKNIFKLFILQTKKKKKKVEKKKQIICCITVLSSLNIGIASSFLLRDSYWNQNYYCWIS